MAENFRCPVPEEAHGEGFRAGYQIVWREQSQPVNPEEPCLYETLVDYSKTMGIASIPPTFAECRRCHKMLSFRLERKKESQLRNFVPARLKGEVELRDEFAPVIARIAAVLPPMEVFRLFASTAGETGGRIIFPFISYGSSLGIVRNCTDPGALLRLDGPDKLPKRRQKYFYKMASEEALKILLWIQIGYGNFRNFENGLVGDMDWADRAKQGSTERMLAIRKEHRMFDEGIHGFAEYRFLNPHPADLFDKYGLEYLLTPHVIRLENS